MSFAFSWVLLVVGVPHSMKRKTIVAPYLWHKAFGFLSLEGSDVDTPVQTLTRVTWMYNEALQTGHRYTPLAPPI